MSASEFPTADVRDLGARFWKWRLDQQPRTSDDIPRVERPRGWQPCWSRADVERYRTELTGFEREWAAISAPAHGGDRAQRALLVDHALVGSAIARARFELDVARVWQRHPGFYIDASLGVCYDLLLPLPPFGDTRVASLIAAFRHVPLVLEWARENLRGMAFQEFAQLAADSLDGIEQGLARVAEALDGEISVAQRSDLSAAVHEAARHLADYRGWLRSDDLAPVPWQPIGAEHLAGFFREVALNPLTIEQMLEIGHIELDRAEALSAIERNCAGGDDLAPLLAGIAEQVERERHDERAIRAFSEERGILSQPDSLGHYLIAPLPEYLKPLRWLGVTDDLTSEGRLDEDAVSYMPDPVEGLPYFYDANARDPRAGIIHEGAHYQQLALSWRHPEPLRRRYYDSGPNEGIAFYNEELMLRSGLFDDAPGTRAAAHSFMRLRALRVLVDLGLASGRMGIQEAGELMAERVPMDIRTALDEAAYFAATPAQGLTYQIGKTQIMAFLADTARAQGDDFSLREFHDSLWLNGNVPIALQRYELLGLTDELHRIRL